MNKPVQLRVPDDARSPARFTAAEFLRMAEAGAFYDMKVELIDGELERMPPPGNDHARRQVSIVVRLAAIVSEALVRAEAGVSLQGHSIVGVDAALLRQEVTGNSLLKPDDILLVVEIAENSLKRDLLLKKPKYAANGIPHYWVIDAAGGIVHVHQTVVDGDYKDVRPVAFGEPLAVPGTDAKIVID